MTMETEYATAKRLSEDEIARQHALLANLPFISEFLDSVPNIILVLNKYRQIVYANKTFTGFLGLSNDDSMECAYADLLGLRPGEAIGCIHSHLTKGGCGTSIPCQNCGATQAILSAQGEKCGDDQECRLTFGEIGLSETSLDLRVWTKTVVVHDEAFVVVCLLNVSDEKRREALEQTFFHDVLNTAGVVLGCSDLLERAESEKMADEGAVDIVHMISESTSRLIEEIVAQRNLSEAERGDLRIRPEDLESLGLLHLILRHFHAQSIASGKQVVIAEGAEEFSFSSDPVLLQRVLINLVKNALEASEKGSSVVIKSWLEGDEVFFSVSNQTIMPEKVQLQIFMRSFSTKGSGRGLGTYSIKLITEKYLKGHVSFISNADEGTVFTVCYPRVISVDDEDKEGLKSNVD